MSFHQATGICPVRLLHLIISKDMVSRDAAVNFCQYSVHITFISHVQTLVTRALYSHTEPLLIYKKLGQ